MAFHGIFICQTWMFIGYVGHNKEDIMARTTAISNAYWKQPTYNKICCRLFTIRWEYNMRNQQKKELNQ